MKKINMARSFNPSARSVRLFCGALFLAAFIILNPQTGRATGCAAPSFGMATTYSIPSSVYRIAVADYNRDGKLDVATANRNTNNISIILGNGMGGFGSPTSFNVGSGPTGIATGDFNRDGKADIVTANYASSSITIMLGDGEGAFTSTIHLAVGIASWSVLVADFDADDNPDFAVNNFNGSVRILMGDGTGGFALLPSTISAGGINLAAADFNDDGNLDLTTAAGESLSILNGHGDGTFTRGPIVTLGMAPSNFVVDDFNADGRLDIAASNLMGNPTKAVVLLNNGQGGFNGPTEHGLNTKVGSTQLFAADLNLDGKPDIASSIYLPGSNNGAVAILPAEGVGGFGPALQTDIARAPQSVVAADLNGDDRPDLLTGDLGPGTGEGTVTVMLNTCTEPPIPRNRIGDFDGDGRTDIAVYRPNGFWYEVRSLNSQFYARPGFGDPGDKLVPGDYDGDRKAEIAVYRPTTGEWFSVDTSTGLYRIRQWGLIGDLPVMGDYDGDGKTDLTVFRPSGGLWFIRHSSDNSIRALQWGATGDVPVSGDFDGDKKTDIAIFRPADGSWWILNSSDNSVTALLWGAGGDRIVPGDYDGDKKTDIAVYRPSEGAWYVLRSSDNTLMALIWGIPTDLPIPGDYDGDGKADVAVYRDGAWFVRYSSDQSAHASLFGTATDIPIPAAYYGN